MYQQTDKNAAIREIQKYLFYISDTKYPSIPRIPIDGVFDNETKSAVLEYQTIKNINPSGIVDYETFSALYGDYIEIEFNSNSSDYIIGDTMFPIVENEQSEDVRVLHVMINELRKKYTEIGDVGTGSFFSKRTADAIEKLSIIFCLPKTRRVNKELYYRMKEEINATNRIK